MDDFDGQLSISDIQQLTYKEIDILKEERAKLLKQRYPKGKFPRLF